MARARLGPSYPTAKCEISLMSSPFFIFYIFHQFNYISATKLQRLIAYSSLTRKHLKKKVRMKYPYGGKAWGQVGGCRSAWGLGEAMSRTPALLLTDAPTCVQMLVPLPLAPRGRRAQRPGPTSARSVGLGAVLADDSGGCVAFF